MYCTQCGNNIPDGMTTCNVCGAQLNQSMGTNGYQQPQQQAYQTNGYQQPQQQAYQTNGYQQPQQQAYQQQYQQGRQNNIQQSAYAQNSGAELGMKWFNFVIYFQLFYNFVMNIYNGYMTCMGKHYRVTDTQLRIIYNMSDGLQTIDIITGITMIGLAVYAIITRFSLAGFRKHGPFMYYPLHIFNVLVSVIYILLVDAIAIGVMVDFTRMYASIAVMVIMLICNIKYFGARKHLFVN